MAPRLRHAPRLVAVLLGAACATAPRPAPPAPSGGGSGGTSGGAPGGWSRGAPGGPSGHVGSAQTPAEIAARATPSIVLVKTATGLGTGFCVAPGIVVTNLHVVAEAEAVTVVAAGSRELKDVEVLAYDLVHDLVLLRAAGLAVPPLHLAQGGPPRAGDHVVAIGHPLGFGNTVSDGLVSAVRELRDEAGGPPLVLLQISAPIAPGSSGGPLFDERGDVVGIATLIITQGQNLNFGVPVSYLQPLLAAGKPRPFAAFARELAALRPHRPARPTPRHDAAILDGCEPAERAVIDGALSSAIDLGAPLFNQGNSEACFRIYEGAALELDRRLKGCVAIRRALLDGVARAGRTQDPAEKAWAMRDAFDGVLEVMRRGTAPAGGAKP